MGGLALFGLFVIFLAVFLLIQDDTLPGGLADRYDNVDNANRDSLVMLWESGDIIGIAQNFQLATLVLSFILFVSIFTGFVLIKNGGKET